VRYDEAAFTGFAARDGVTKAALVIGYGNGLRSDDGAGTSVARLLATPDDVAVLVRDQLVPELAADLQGRAVVVFVDAATTLGPGTVAVRRLTTSEAAETPRLTHHFGPAALLLLAERLYGARPCAFLVTIGAASFALGEDLSPEVAAALPEAAAVVRRLIDAPPDEVSCAPYPAPGRRHRSG
jgi:hydrogenase maturation protease